MENNSNHDDPNSFEFGSITPTSPSSDPSKTVSPADQFFLNGRLLPHSFPSHHQTMTTARRSTSECNSRATTSRTSSMNAGSMLSSRSNSTNSSRSNTTCSSARTSASDVSERKAFQRKLVYNRTFSHGSSQRWQFITPAPVLDPSLSRRRRFSGEMKTSPVKRKSKSGDDQRLGFCQRLLRSFVRNCRACHAMEGAAIGDDDDFGTHLEIK